MATKKKKTTANILDSIQKAGAAAAGTASTLKTGGAKAVTTAAKTKNDKPKTVSQGTYASKSSVGGQRSSALKKQSALKSANTPRWKSSTVELKGAEGARRFLARNYDMQFTPEYFANNKRYSELYLKGEKNMTALELAETMDMSRRVQAGENYRTRMGGGTFAAGDQSFGANDSANSVRDSRQWAEFIKKADETDIAEVIKTWQANLDAAGGAESDYGKRTAQDLEELKKYAVSTYTSFADQQVKDLQGQVSNYQRQLEQLQMGDQFRADAQRALRAIDSGSNDAITLVQTDPTLRSLTDFDTLRQRYNDDGDLYAALYDRIYNIAQGNAGKKEESVQLADEKSAVERQLKEATENYDNLKLTDYYRALGNAGGAENFSVDPYQYATPYQWTDPTSGITETRYQYNTPTLAQMIDDQENVAQEYRRAVGAGGAALSAQDIDLVRFMTDDEILQYKNVYGSEGADAAQEWFDRIMRDELLMRQTQEQIEQTVAFTEDKPIIANAAQFATNQLANMQDKADLIRTLLGGEPSAVNQFREITNAITGTTMENTKEATAWANFNLFGNEVNPFVFLEQAGYAAGNEALNKILYGPLSPHTMALDSAASGFVDSYRERGDTGAAALTAIANYLSEYYSEKAGDKLLGGADELASPKDIIKYLGANTGGEALEEVLSFVGSTAGETIAGRATGAGSPIEDEFKYLTNNGYSSEQARAIIAKKYGFEALEQGIVGGISGFGMSGGNVAINSAGQNLENRSIGKKIIDSKNAAHIIEMGLQSEDPSVQRISEKLLDKLSSGEPDAKPTETAAEMQYVAEAVANENQNGKVSKRKQEKEALEKARQQKVERAKAGELKGDYKGSRAKLGKLYKKVLGALDVKVDASADVMRSVLKDKLAKLGETPADEVIDAIVAVAKVNGVTKDDLDLAWIQGERNGVIKDIIQGYDKSGLAEARERAMLFRQATQREITDKDIKAVEKAGSELNEAVAQKENKSVVQVSETGETSYTTEEGEVIAAKVESFATNDSGELVAVMDGAQVPVDHVQAADDAESTLLARAAGLKDAEAATAMYEDYDNTQDVDSYTRGFEAVYNNAIIGRPELKVRQLKLASGLTDAQFTDAYRLGSENAAARQPRPALKTGGKVTFAGDLKQRMAGLDANQKSAVNALKRFAEIGGVNIEFFESTADEEGSYKKFVNGSYNPATNTISIDIHAGKDSTDDIASYALLRVAGHELTHYIKAQNTEGYTTLQEFVFDELAKRGETTLDELIASKMEQQPDLSYADAAEEVVADGCEMMLRDSTVAQRLAETNRGLFNRIRSWLRNFAQSVRRAFQGVSAHSDEAKLLEKVEGLQKVWDDALVKAIENVRGVQHKPKSVSAAPSAASNTTAYTAEAHIDQRTDDSIAEQEPFFNDFDDLRDIYAYNTAVSLWGDVTNSEAAQKVFVWESGTSQPDVLGQKRATTELIAKYKDKYKWTWDQMGKLLTRFTTSIEEGKPIPNTANMKRLELMIDDALTNGYTDIAGIKVAPAKDYIIGKAGIEGSLQNGMNNTEGTPDGVEWGEYVTGIPESEAKFSMRNTVEQRKNLIAIHNLTVDKLSKALKLGGFPMPSIAIAKDNIGHQNFGDISLVFGQSTIDPKANRKNKVYSADAWTPTFPRIEYEADANVEKRIRSTLDKLGSRMENHLNEQMKRVIYGIDEYLNRFEGEAGFIDYVMRNYGVKAAFLEDQGQHVDIVKVEKPVGKTFSEKAAADYQKAIELFGKDMENISRIPLSEIREKYGAELEDIRPGITKSAMRMSGFIRHVIEYQQSANQEIRYEMVDDYGATERWIDDNMDKQAFEAWIKQLFGGIEGNSGVYNNKPLFTDSGNRRSFSSTHMPVSVENIAKAMATQGNTKNISGFNGIKSVRAATARTFKDVSEMHQYENRIQNRTEAETESLNTELDNRLYGLIHEVLGEKYPNGNSGTDHAFSLEYAYAMDSLGEVFLEMAESKYNTTSIKSTLSKYGYHVSDGTAEVIKQLFDDTAIMPVNIYEAKPERAVGFDEVRYAVVPSDMDAEVRAELEKVVSDVREYTPGDENSRLEVLNSRSDTKFSRRAGNKNVYTMTREQYNRFGWTTKNDILSPEEVSEIEHRNRKDFNGKNPGVRTKDGLWALPIGEEHGIDNVIAVTDMKFGNPRIERVYRIYSDDENYNEKVRDEIYGIEAAYGRESIKYAETVLESRSVLAYSREDYLHLYEDRGYMGGEGRRSSQVDTQAGELQERSGRETSAYKNGPVDEKFSTRTDNLTDRGILAAAFENVAQNENERDFLKRYKGKIKDLYDLQSQLTSVRKDIKDLMFTAGKRPPDYKARLAELNGKANALAEAINRVDKRLLGFESAKPLRDVLARERAKVEKEGAAKRKAMREARAETELRHRIRNLADDFNRRLKSPTERRYIPSNMVQLIVKVQELVDTRSGRERDQEKASEKLAEIHRMYARYKEDSMYSFVHDETIDKMLLNLANKTAGKNIYQLNKEDLKMVYETMKGLRKQVTDAAKLKSKAYSADMFKTGKQMFRDTQEAAPLLRGVAGDYINWQLTPDKFFSRLAGHKKGSAWMEVAKSFSDGTQKMLEIQRDAYYHFRKWTESKEFDKLGSLKDSDLIDIGLKDASGKPVKVTRGMMLEVYMHLQNEDNIAGFMYGGFSVPQMKKYYAGKVAESYGTGSINTVGTSVELAELAEKLRDPDLTDEQRAEIEQQMEEAEARGMDSINRMRQTIESKLTAWDRGLIEAVHEWNDVKSRNYINDVTMDMYDIKRAQVENYYPIRRDTAFVNTDFESISRNMNLENWGALKERVKSRAPILLGDIAFTVDNSVKQTSKYVGYVRAQRDFNKLYNVRLPDTAGGSVKKIVATKFGTGDRSGGASGTQYIENYIGSITGSRKSESDFLTVIRRNLPRATMSLNFRVGLSQISALPKAAAEVGWKNLAEGMANGGAKAIFSKKAREELARKNAWFWQRYQGEGGQREFADAKGGRGAIDRAWNAADDFTRGWLLNLNQKVDVATTAAMWSSAEAWVRNNRRDLARGSEAFENAVNEKYTDILRNTQAANTVSERSDLARGSGGINSILTMYKSEAFANFNILYDSVARLKKYADDLKEGKNGVTKADVKKARWQLANSITSVVIASSVLNAVIKLGVNAIFSNMSGYRDDEDEITAASIAGSIGKEMLNDAAGMVAVGSIVYDAVAAVVFDETYYGPSYAVLDDFTTATKATINYLNDEDKTVEDFAKAAEKVGKSAFNMLGIPANNAKRQVEGLVNTIRDIAAGRPFSFEASAQRSNSTNYSRMLSASLKGNEEKYTQVFAELMAGGMEENDVYSRYRGVLKDAYQDGDVSREQALKLLVSHGGKTEDEAYWLADEWDYEGDGNYSKYGDIRTALAAGNQTEAEAAIAELIEHGTKAESIASEMSKVYNNGESTTILTLQLRPGGLYTPSKPKGSEDDFDAYFEALLSGRDTREEVKRLRSLGYTTKNIMTALNNAFGNKQSYRFARMVSYNPTEAAILEERILDAYVVLGLNREKERVWIHENWTMPEEE